EDRRRQNQAVDENDERRSLEVLKLGRFDFAVYLRQGLLAAHRQDRMPEGNEQPQYPHSAQEPKAAQKTKRVVWPVDIQPRDVANFLDRLILFGDFFAVLHLRFEEIVPARVPNPYALFLWVIALGMP